MWLIDTLWVYYFKEKWSS